MVFLSNSLHGLAYLRIYWLVIWALLDSFGSFWALLGSFGIFWALMDSWAFWGLIGSFWALLGPFKHFWVYLGSFGLIWAHLGSFGPFGVFTLPLSKCVQALISQLLLHHYHDLYILNYILRLLLLLY